MKLKCEEHERRVLVLEKSTIHRSDGTKCNSAHLRIGASEFHTLSFPERVNRKRRKKTR